MPLVVHGPWNPSRWSTSASALGAVKSSVLFAGLNTPGTTTVIEREATRIIPRICQGVWRRP